MNLFLLILYAEVLTAIIGSIFYKKYNSSFLKYFLYLLWFVVAVELTILGFKNAGIRFQNNFIYNIVTTIQYVYFFLLYIRTMKTPRYKKWVRYMFIIFLVSITINFTWIQKLGPEAIFHSHTFVIGAILLIISISLFLVEILNSEKVLYFQRYLSFWISIGLFIYYTGIIPYTLGLNFFTTLLSTDSLSVIFFALNMAMYSCFITGFILSKKYTD